MEGGVGGAAGPELVDSFAEDGAGDEVPGGGLIGETHDGEGGL